MPFLSHILLVSRYAISKCAISQCISHRAPRILKRKCHGSILILIELLVKGLSYNLLIFYLRSYLKTISARYCFEIARRTMMPMINRPRSKSECATANVFRHFLKIMKIHKELFRGNKMRYFACSNFFVFDRVRCFRTGYP